MKYSSSTAAETQNFSRGVLVEDHRFEKRAAATVFDVFLSHSSADKDALPQVIGFLGKNGARVYIDKADKELPQKTSAETGAKSRSELLSAPSLSCR